jgi:hypothetical protein|tara:strand:+ start:2153 stop:2794 length:642 start_codon:yes stop_codon:yes gene_type:complete
MKKKTKKKLLSVLPGLTAVALVGVLGLGLLATAYSGGSPKYLVEGDLNVTEAVQPAVVVAEPALGAFPGTDIYVAPRFNVGFGNRVLATSTTGSAVTLAERDLLNYDIFEMSNYTQNLTITLPATSTLSGVLRDPGDRRTFMIRSMTTTTGATVPTITVAAGIGWDLLGVDANVDVIAPNVTLTMDCYRESSSSTLFTSSNIVCGLQELIAVD